MMMVLELNSKLKMMKMIEVAILVVVENALVVDSMRPIEMDEIDLHRL